MEKLNKPFRLKVLDKMSSWILNSKIKSPFGRDFFLPAD
jgi:hypothetical protein